MRDGILKGIRGPHGGYALAREGKRITAEDILRRQTTRRRTAIRHCRHRRCSSDVVRPALAEAERAFGIALARISIEDMVRQRRSR